jgi:nitronate monooxygenase
LRNHFTEELRGAEDDVLAYPLQLALTAPLCRDTGTSGIADALLMLSGQAAGLTREMPAGELVRLLADEAATGFRRGE